MLNEGRVSEIMGLAGAAPGFAESQAPFGDIEALVLEGLPREALRRVALRIGGDADRASAIEYAIVPKTTLARRGTGRLTREESERTERLARLFILAEEVLGSEEAARTFLRRPHPELGHRTPLDAATTELGGRRVEAILQALEYGLPV